MIVVVSRTLTGWGDLFYFSVFVPVSVLVLLVEYLMEYLLDNYIC
jgi:hypothetical protein